MLRTLTTVYMTWTDSYYSYLAVVYMYMTHDNVYGIFKGTHLVLLMWLVEDSILWCRNTSSTPPNHIHHTRTHILTEYTPFRHNTSITPMTIHPRGTLHTPTNSCLTHNVMHSLYTYIHSSLSTHTHTYTHTQNGTIKKKQC